VFGLFKKVQHSFTYGDLSPSKRWELFSLLQCQDFNTFASIVGTSDDEQAKVKLAVSSMIEQTDKNHSSSRSRTQKVLDQQSTHELKEIFGTVGDIDEEVTPSKEETGAKLVWAEPEGQTQYAKDYGLQPQTLNFMSASDQNKLE